MKGRKEHKCFYCVWSSWTGIKYVCMQPRCIRNLEKAFVKRG